MKVTSGEQSQFEPTVFSAVRRHWLTVAILALLVAGLGSGYALLETKQYRADATITVPPTSSAQRENGDQYLDSQVLLLQSQEVAARAARLTNATVGSNVVSPIDFGGERKSLKITPPRGANSGSYGTSVISVSFTWRDPRVAQTAANAVLQAFDDARDAAIKAQGEAMVAGIDKAIADARTRAQRSDLISQRTKALVDQQVDLAGQPTIAWAALPQAPVNGNAPKFGAIGLLMGTVLGAGLAYALAIRRRCFDDPLEPATVYGAPFISEVPTSQVRRRSSRRTTGAGLLPVASAPRSTAAEAFRFAAGYVERRRVAHGNPLVIAFASTFTNGTRSAVVANLALATAQSGTAVLAVDADPMQGGLTALLLPDTAPVHGFEQVLNGQRSVSECVLASPVDERLAVLGQGSASAERLTGVAYARGMEELVGKAKASFDLVLIDSPALLQVADAAEVVDNSDATIVVIGPGEPVRDHVTMVDRIDLVGADLIGYMHQRGQRGARRPRNLHEGRPATHTVKWDEWSDAPSW